MDHGLGLIIGILEILEIEVFIFPIILEILEISIFQVLVSWKYWKSQFFNFPGILEVLKTFFAGGRAGAGRGPGAAEPSGGPGGGAPRRDGALLKRDHIFVFRLNTLLQSCPIEGLPKREL